MKTNIFNPKTLLATVATFAVATVAVFGVMLFSSQQHASAQTNISGTFAITYQGPDPTGNGTIYIRPQAGSPTGCTAASNQVLTFGANTATSPAVTLVSVTTAGGACVYDVRIDVPDEVAIGGIYSSFGHLTFATGTTTITLKLYQDVENVNDVWRVVKDKIVEYLPEVLTFLGSFLGIVIVIMLIRRGVRRMTGMVTGVGTG